MDRSTVSAASLSPAEPRCIAHCDADRFYFAVEAIERPELAADPRPIVIGHDCVIGHNVILHGAKVGDNSLIGMGAILLNGATIGMNSLVGAGALVTEGKSFPDNSLIVGSPARVVRTLDEKAAAMIRGAADIYVRRWQRYAQGLKKIG